MSTVLAAVDNSPVARPVVETAAAFARLLDASLAVLHVHEDSAGTARAAARSVGAPFTTIEAAAPQEAIIRAAREPDVIAVAVGARRVHGGRSPAGHIPLAVITAVPKPVLVVPPEARSDGRLDTLLAPLDGTTESAETVADVVDLARRANLRVVVLHVHTPETVPMFEDQAQHTGDAWTREFVARHCGCSVEDVDVELRVGMPGREVASVARDAGADLIALGWRRNLARGHAATVREVLASSDVPVLLVPLRSVNGDGPAPP
jgi:nucleotide-binding universal stress UspA family protein